MTKIRNIKKLPNGTLLFRYKLLGRDKYIPLQLNATATALQIQTRRDDIAKYIPFVKSGEITESQLLTKLRWFEQKADASTNTLMYWEEIFMQNKENENLAPKSLDRLQNSFNVLFDRCIIRNGNECDCNKDVCGTNIYINEFDNQCISKFIKRKSTEIKQKTINLHLSNLGQFAKFLFEEGLIKKVPQIKKVKVTDNDENKRVTEAQYNMMMDDELLSDICKDVVDTIYYCGMRANELKHGKMLDNSLIIVPEIEKNNKHKSIDVPSWAAEVVLRIQEDYRTNRTVYANRIRESMERCGFYVKDKTKPLHSLRHSYLSRMFLLTGSEIFVQETIGHSNSNTTMGYVADIKELMEDFPTDAKESIYMENIDRIKKMHDRVAKSRKRSKRG